MQPAGCPCCAYQQPLSGPRLFTRATLNWEWATGESKRKVAVDSGSTRTLLLDGGTIVDPRDGSTAVNVSVRMRNGRIVEVSPSEAAREDPATERIDAAGRFIVPGYNDMHSHALNLADPSASLALMLAEGVTGFRQMSGSPALLKKRRDNALPIGPAAPALLETPGTVLTPLNSGSSKAVAAEIRRQHDQGADFAHFDWPCVSRRQVLLFPTCAHDELTPPIHRTPPGPHAGSSLAEGTPTAVFLCPGACEPPGFGVIQKPFDASAVVHSCSSSRRLPDPLLADRFRNAHHPGS